MHMALGDGDQEQLLEAAFPVSLKAIFSGFSILLELLFDFPVWKPWLYLSPLLYTLSPKDMDVQSQEAGGQIEDKSNKNVTPFTFWGCHLSWLENRAPCPQFRLLTLLLPLCWHFRALWDLPRWAWVKRGREVICLLPLSIRRPYHAIKIELQVFLLELCKRYQHWSFWELGVQSEV